MNVVLLIHVEKTKNILQNRINSRTYCKNNNFQMTPIPNTHFQETPSIQQQINFAFGILDVHSGL